MTFSPVGDGGDGGDGNDAGPTCAGASFVGGANESALISSFCGVFVALGSTMLFWSSKPVTFGAFLMAIAISAAAAVWLDARYVMQHVGPQDLAVLGKSVFDTALRLVGWGGTPPSE